MLSVFSERLYARVWLAIVVCVLLLSALIGLAWHLSNEHNKLVFQPPQILIRTLDGDAVGTAQVKRQPDGSLSYEAILDSGQHLLLPLPRRSRPGGDGPPGAYPSKSSSPAEDGFRDERRSLGPPPWWARPPYGFIWLLAGLGLLVSMGIYPVVRRLTQRLEGLQRNVQRWGEGDLSARVPVRGQDEIADLASHFNAAAERIEQLMATQHQLLAAQKSLLANASHELRSPLTRIRMGLELMGAQSSPNFRTEITRNISELDQLIDEILLASRLDAHEADLGSIDLIDVLGLAAEESARLHAELELHTDIAHLQVYGVAKLLRRLVRNLLENARRYGNQTEGHSVDPNATPDIVLSLSHETQGDTDFAVLRVLDRGPGVPPELRERIFEPFYRLPGASERHGGVGLGLALVKSIAERHGGSVHCEDREGGGACFVVKLPVGKATL